MNKWRLALVVVLLCACTPIRGTVATKTKVDARTVFVPAHDEQDCGYNLFFKMYMCQTKRVPDQTLTYPTQCELVIKDSAGEMHRVTIDCADYEKYEVGGDYPE